MKAILWKHFGGAEALELVELPTPEPKSDELLMEKSGFDNQGQGLYREPY